MQQELLLNNNRSDILGIAFRINKLSRVLISIYYDINSVPYIAHQKKKL
jgi:hypothetical protein